MEKFVNINPQNKVVQITAPASMTLEVLEQALTELKAAFTGDAKLKVLTDLRQVAHVPPIELLKKLTHAIKNNRTFIEKSAFMVESATMISALQTVMLASGRGDIRLFKKETEALAWLTDPSMNTDDDDLLFGALESVIQHNQAPSAASCDPSGPQSVPSPLREGEKVVLVVEDNLAIQTIYKKIIQKEFPSYRLCDADNGAKAWDILDKINVDILVSDLMMPEVSGLDLIRKVRKDPRFDAMKIIVVTTLGDKTNVLHAMQAGANDFMVKPISSKMLTERITALLSAKK